MSRLQPEAGFAQVSEVYLVVSARWLEASGGRLVKGTIPPVQRLLGSPSLCTSKSRKAVSLVLA